MNKVFKHIVENKLLFLIIVTAVTLRLWNISSNPPSLNWDEVSHGYNAYSILKTGEDEWGDKFPLIFRAYGDYKLPVYIYLTAISEGLLGISTLAVRLPSALAGVGSVIFTYLLVMELGKLGGFEKFVRFHFSKTLLDKSEKGFNRVALLSAFLVAVEPWSLFLSRGAFEANLAQVFIIAGVYYFLRFTNSHNSLFLIHTSILLGLSVWTYNSARVFVPMLLAFLGCIFRREIRVIWERGKIGRIRIIIALLLVAIFLVPMFYQLANPVGQARYSKVAILDEGAINQINEARNTSRLSPLLARSIHNKATFFGKEFTKNYLSHYSPRYLFFEGGDQYQFSVPNHGLLYFINLPFLYLGLLIIIYSLYKNHDRYSLLLISWLLFAPIPSSLTREAPHVLRSITLLPIPMLISAIGVTWVVNISQNKWKMENRKWKILFGVYVLVLSILSYRYLLRYHTTYRNDYSWSWQYGYRQAVQYTKEHYYDYDKILVTKKYGEPHEFFIFYNKWDPNEFRNDPNLIRFKQSDWFWVDAFDKYYFINDWQILPNKNVVPVLYKKYEFELESGGNVDCSTDRCLLITSPGNVPPGWNKLETIELLDGEAVFEIYDNKLKTEN